MKIEMLLLSLSCARGVKGLREALHCVVRVRLRENFRRALRPPSAVRICRVVAQASQDVAKPKVSQKCHKDVAMVSRDVAEVSQKCHRFVANCHKMSQGVTAKDITGHQPPTASHAATSAASLAAA